MSLRAPSVLPTLPPGVTIRHLGDGETGRLIRETDWSQHPLGPFERWPQTLKGYVAAMLALPSPAVIFWGPERYQLYNDGYAAIMGLRHPRYLGAPYRECWPETYSVIEPWVQQGTLGDVVEVDKTLIPVTRHGFIEESHFTFSISPLNDDQNQVGGLLHGGDRECPG